MAVRPTDPRENPALGHATHVISGRSLGRGSRSLDVECPETIASIPEQDLMRNAALLGGFDGSCFVDVGAHCGFWTLMLSDVFDCCIALEPAEYQFKLLETNIIRNGLKNAVASRCAASDIDATGVLNIMGLSGGNNSLGRQSDTPMRTEQVRKVRLDSLELPRVGLIKIDVEGHEYEVLLGGLDTIKKYLPAIVIEISCDSKVSQVGGLLGAVDYELCLLHRDRGDMFLAVPRRRGQ